MDDDDAGDNGDHGAATPSRHAVVVLAQRTKDADKIDVSSPKDIFIGASDK